MGGLAMDVPTDADWAEIIAADERGFGFSYGPEEPAEIQPSFDLTRFRVLRDRGRIVGLAGSVGLDVTLPGGSTVPMGGVTWVSVAATHRRQGNLRRLMDACHADIDERGEPLATLTASEGGIYERFGYGAASTFRAVRILPRATAWRDPSVGAVGAVRYLSDDEVRSHVPAVWDRARRLVTGEVDRPAVWHDMLRASGSRSMGDRTPLHYLGHADGYASYRMRAEWSTGIPGHEASLADVVAVTPEAHAALWRTLLEMDLVETIVKRRFPVDDPLPYLLTNARAVQTTSLLDGIWVNVRDVAVCFGARTYSTDDAVVVEVVDELGASRRYRIDGGPEGAEVRPARTRPDLTMSRASLGALLYGGVRPSALAAGRRLTARSDDALRRADVFFPTSRQPFCQTPY